MPILKKKITLRLGRNSSLFIDLEAGVTGLEGVASGLGSRLGRVPRLARAAARLPGGAVRITSARRKGARLERGSKTPVFFVTGVGKSGTSWLMRMLDSHPEILCKGEGRFFAADWRRANFDPEGTQALASSLYYALLHSEYLRMWVERSVWAREGDAARHLDNLTRLACQLAGGRGNSFEAGLTGACEQRNRTELVRGHEEFISRTSRDPGAPVAQREPRRAGAAARATATDRRRLDLDPEARNDARGGGFLQRRGPIDRDAADARVLEREPAQDARLTPGPLGFLERGSPEAGRVEQEHQLRAGKAVSRDCEREGREELEVVLVDRGVHELPGVLERERPAALGQPPLDGLQP